MTTKKAKEQEYAIKIQGDETEHDLAQCLYAGTESVKDPCNRRIAKLIVRIAQRQTEKLREHRAHNQGFCLAGRTCSYNRRRADGQHTVRVRCTPKQNAGPPQPRALARN